MNYGTLASECANHVAAMRAGRGTLIVLAASMTCDGPFTEVFMALIIAIITWEQINSAMAGIHLGNMG